MKGQKRHLKGDPKGHEAQDEEGEKMKEIMLGRFVSQDSLDWLPWGQVLKSGPISCVVGAAGCLPGALAAGGMPLLPQG